MGIGFGARAVGKVFEHLRDFLDMLVHMVVLSGSVVFLDVLLEMFLLLVVETVFVGLGVAGVGDCAQFLLHGKGINYYFYQPLFLFYCKIVI